ncbi:hypothetical protein TUM17384_08970 [Shewanella algae]|nr:hypothetical protein TUM17384_08970 [Shewanella algae]
MGSLSQPGNGAAGLLEQGVELLQLTLLLKQTSGVFGHGLAYRLQHKPALVLAGQHGGEVAVLRQCLVPFLFELPQLQLQLLQCRLVLLALFLEPLFQ